MFKKRLKKGKIKDTDLDYQPDTSPIVTKKRKMNEEAIENIDDILSTSKEMIQLQDQQHSDNVSQIDDYDVYIDVKKKPEIKTLNLDLYDTFIEVDDHATTNRIVVDTPDDLESKLSRKSNDMMNLLRKQELKLAQLQSKLQETDDILEDTVDEDKFIRLQQLQSVLNVLNQSFVDLTYLKRAALVKCSNLLKKSLNRNLVAISKALNSTNYKLFDVEKLEIKKEKYTVVFHYITKIDYTLFDSNPSLRTIRQYLFTFEFCYKLLFSDAFNGQLSCILHMDVSWIPYDLLDAYNLINNRSPVHFPIYDIYLSQLDTLLHDNFIDDMITSLFMGYSSLFINENITFIQHLMTTSRYGPKTKHLLDELLLSTTQ